MRTWVAAAAAAAAFVSCVCLVSAGAGATAPPSFFLSVVYLGSSAAVDQMPSSSFSSFCFVAIPLNAVHDGYIVGDFDGGGGEVPFVCLRS